MHNWLKTGSLSGIKSGRNERGQDILATTESCTVYQAEAIEQEKESDDDETGETENEEHRTQKTHPDTSKGEGGKEHNETRT